MNSLFKTGFWRGVACARAAEDAKPRADCFSTLERAAKMDCMACGVFWVGRGRRGGKERPRRERGGEGREGEREERTNAS